MDDIEQTEEIEAEETEGTSAPEPTEAEKSALNMGWVPKEEFKGDPALWVDADTYMSRSKNERKLAGTVRSLEKTVNFLQDQIKHVTQSSYEKAKADILAQQRKAVEEGDTATFERLESEKENLQKPTAQAKDETDPVLESWAEDNPWFNNDDELQEAAILQYQLELKKHPAWTTEDRLGEVTKKIRKNFPEKFENPARKQASAVEGSRPTGGTRAKSFASLPQECKDSFEMFVAQGAFKDTDDDRAKYAKRYYELAS